MWTTLYAIFKFYAYLLSGPSNSVCRLRNFIRCQEIFARCVSLILSSKYLLIKKINRVTS